MRAHHETHTHNYVNDDGRRFKLLDSHQLAQMDYTMKMP